MKPLNSKIFLKLILSIILTILVLHKNVNCARILGVFPSPALSHNKVYQPIVRELSLRGHEVISIIPDLINDPSLTNLTEIDINFTYEIWHRFNKFTKERLENYTPIQSMYGMSQGLLELCDRMLAIPAVKKIINDPNEHFDLVINEWLLFPSTFAFAEKFNCPIVGVTSFGLNLHGHDSIGNPMNPAYSPDFYLPYSHKLSFWQRVYSTIYAVWYRFYFHFKLLPQHDVLAKKHFGANMPYLSEIMKRITTVFISENPILTGPKPTVPLLFPVSGLHFKPRKPLPADLQKICDNAPEGFIYFSMGTNVKSKNIPEDRRRNLLEVLAELPYTVLWKYENDTVPDLPKNVIIRKWFPQEDVLAHPKIKLYLMQGGLQSTEEAIRSRVPMIAIPFFADQEINAARYMHHGIGDRLGFEQLVDKNIIREKLTRVINDKGYKERMTKLSELMWDTPMKSLDQAIWWIEYVIRHKGAYHLRSLSADLPWYQLLLLDVIGLFLAGFLVSVFVVVYLIRKVIAGVRKLRGKPKRE